MKKFVIMFAALVSGLAAYAQVELADVVGRLDSNRIDAEFSCRIAGDIPLDCKGKALAQGRNFVVRANGMEAYCDGERLVLVDPKAKEVYIESATGLEDYLKSNMGSVTELRFYELHFLERSEDLSAFRFDTSALDSSWIVTDLRQE